MAGLLTRLWGILRSKQLVGVDKVGNCYFRQSRKMDGELIEKRWVEFKGDPDPTSVPVEWTSWLSGRRQEAPTPKEIMALESQRKLVKLKAAMLEKEEEKRCFRSKSLQQDLGTEEVKPPEMDRFIQQVATLEGANFDGGEGIFADGVSSEPTLIDQNSRFSERTVRSDAFEEDSIEKNQQGMTEPKGNGNAYKPGTWMPP